MGRTGRRGDWVSTLLLLLIVTAALLGALILNFGPPSTPEGFLDLHQQGLTLISRRQFEDAEKVLTGLVARVPDQFVPRFNLGIAQLNQAEAGIARATESLVIARTIRPEDPRVAYCLGIIHRFTGSEEKALEEFQWAADRLPKSADAQYQLAISLLHLGRKDEALPHFEIVVRLDPTLLGAWHNLQLMYRRAGRIEDADRSLDQFMSLREDGRGKVHGLKYTEQGDPAEAIRDWRLTGALAREGPPILFSDGVEIGEPIIGRPPVFAFVDSDLDCIPDLWVAGEKGISWHLGGPTPLSLGEIDLLSGVRTFAVGDIDEDGLADLITATGDVIRSSKGDGTRLPTFVPLASMEVGTPVADLRLVDLDLEGDLDLIIVPERGTPLISINEGRDLRAPGESPRFPLTLESSRVELLAVRDIDGDDDADVVVDVAVDGPQLILNGPQWRFERVEEGEFPLAGNVTVALLADVDGDLRDDWVVVRPGGELSVLSSSRGAETVIAGTLTEVSALHGADLDLDGDLDLVVSGRFGEATKGSRVLINAGDGTFTLAALNLPAAEAFVSADVDGDLDLDLVLVTVEGQLLFLRNETEARSKPWSHHALRIYLGGRRDKLDRRTNLLGYGARVTVLAGELSQSTTFEGSIGCRAQGLAPLLVGLGPRPAIGSLIIDWPDGVLQGERDVAVDGCEVVEEIQRKSSSCPVLFTWDGTEFSFISDFMGGGGLGFWSGPDLYGPPEPTEVVRIAPGLLEPLAGDLVLSVMEPMQEACYIDRLQLIAIDHRPGTEVYPEEYFPVGGVAPSGEPLVVKSDQRFFPAFVEGNTGPHEPDLLAAVDRRYLEPSSLVPDWVGYASRESWRLRFDGAPQSSRSFLFIDGWVEYPYSRINFAAWQKGDRLEAPSFWWRRQEEDPWHLIGEEFGYPAGMPKTMVVDVSAAIAQGAREFRIDSNLEFYLDRVFLAGAMEIGGDGGCGARRISLPLRTATLRFGGYPAEYSDDGALPATYHYRERQATLDYDRMGGLLTRYGEVGSLIEEIDDRFAILGGGDELLLRYDASALPPLADGWSRTYLLDTHGYCKDRDPLTATRESIEPLPFAAMESYPPTGQVPEPDRSLYRQRWNSRSD